MTFKKALQLLKDNRKIIFYMLIAMLATAVFGYLQPNRFEELKQNLIGSMVEGVEDKSAIEVTVYIITNNLKSAALSILLGIAFLPLVALSINGYFLGAVLHDAIDEAGVFIVWRILPHGVIEIPAICIAFAFGLRIGLCWFDPDRWNNFKRTYKEAFTVLVWIVLPMLIVAGILEGTLYWIVA